MRSSRWLLLAMAVGVALSLTACGKKATVAVTGAPPVQSAPPQASPVEKEAPYQVRELQLSVEAYEKIYKRKPASLEQMVQERFLASLPPAPPGKKYYLDPATGRVSLVP